MGRVALILTVLASLIAAPAMAVEVTTLYQADTQLTEQSQKAQAQALRRAMEQVLTKVSGDVDIAAHPQIKPSLAKVNDFVLQYRFENRKQKRYLHAEFDSNKINRLILQADLPLWGKRRPSVLIWLVIEQESGYRRLVTDADVNDVASMLKETAEERGLPVILPLGDMTDLTSIDMLDIWGRFVEPAKEASKRYASDSFVVARMMQVEPDALELPSTDEQDNEGAAVADSTAIPTKTDAPLVKEWRVDWRLPNEMLSTENSAQAKTSAEAATAFINGMTNQFASNLAIEALDGLNEYHLRVSNVASVKMMTQIESYLRSLTAVGDVVLKNISGQSMEFSLVLIGQESDVKQALELGSKLNIISKPFGERDELDEYSWASTP